MNISVIIPTKNRCGDLLVTLENICKNTSFPDEIIIVDQTTENQESKLRQFIAENYSELNVKYIHKPEIDNLVDAKDHGFKQSGGDIVTFLDDDITVFPDFFESLIGLYKEYPETDAICAVDILEGKKSIWRVLARCMFWIGPFWNNKSLVEKFHSKIKRPVKTTAFSGGYMSCKRYVYKSFRFYRNKNLKTRVFVEDLDFSFRAAQRFNLVIAPKLKVIHRGGLNPLYDIEEAEKRRVNARIYFFKKNVEKKVFNYVALVWLIVGTFLGAVARGLSHRSFKPIKGFFKGLSDAYQG
jgi:glycosyltransferase involved in cell wall biosynthesis